MSFCCQPSFDELSNPREMELESVDFLPILTMEHIESLAPFYAHLECGFEKAPTLAPDDKQYSLKIAKTVKAIIGWNVGDDFPTGSSTREFYKPCCVAEVRVGVQPILNAIMFKMIQVLGLEEHVTHDQGMQNVANRPGRVVEFVLSPLPEECSLDTIAAVLGKTIKLKPVACRNNEVDQLKALSTLADKVTFFFNFGGVGDDCTLVGVALTMESIVVLVLELSGVGTANVLLTTKRTKRAPLFDIAPTVTADIVHGFGEEATMVDEEQEMPAGFGLLARTLMSAFP